MNWYHDLYLSENVKKKKDQLIRKIESGKTPVNTYLLALPSGAENQLEILPGIDFKFWNKNKECPMIVGIASSKTEACELVRDITEEIYQKTGGVKLREYFERG